MSDGAARLPRVTIEFCTQCKWLLRAAYYAQELLSTFPTLGEVALQPSTGGTFIITITPETKQDESRAMNPAEHESRAMNPAEHEPQTTTSTEKQAPKDTSLGTAHDPQAESQTTTPTEKQATTSLYTAHDPQPEPQTTTPTEQQAPHHHRQTNPPQEPQQATQAHQPQQPRPLPLPAITLWDRRRDGGFPETKVLKRRVRDIVEPLRALGHVDRCTDCA